MILDCPSCHHRYDVSKYKPGQRLRCACGQILEVPGPGYTTQAVRAFHCAACGGNLEKGERRCTYCGALVDLSETRLTMYCPSCLTMSKAGSRFCSGCGQALTTALEVPGLADEQCPRCGVQMRNRSIERHRIVECPMCLGMFVAVDTFDALIREQEARIEETPSKAPQRGPARDLTVTYIKCPVCKGIMNRMNFGRISGVIVDYCRQHGYWLDDGELKKIADWVAAGGLKEKYVMEMEEAKSQTRRARLEQPLIAADTRAAPEEDHFLLKVLSGLFGG